MNKCCVYMVNQHPLYMNMACNSIAMLRKHSAIPVRVLLITDFARTTFSNTRNYPGLELDVSDDAVKRMSDRLVVKCEEMGAEVKVLSPHAAETDYIHCNQSYMATECPEELVMKMDADTFLFGDIEPVFNAYDGYDVVALEADWFKKEKEWKPEWFGNQTPLSTAVILFRNETAKRWGEFLPGMCRAYAEGDSDAAIWARNRKILYLRDELSLTPFVICNTLKWRLFREEHCCQISAPEFWKNIIAHAFGYNWLKAYQMLTGSKDLPLRAAQ